MAKAVMAAVLIGVDAHRVEVRVDLTDNLPRTTVVGLSEASGREILERVRSAIDTVGFRYPRRRVAISLTPADLPKDASLDLAIAVALLVADGQVPDTALDRFLFAGELSLSGFLRPIRGGLPLALLAKEGQREIVISASNASSAAISGGTVLGVTSLSEVVALLRGEREIEPTPTPTTPSPARPSLDLSDIRGHQDVRRALEIAAAGGHSLLLIGPSGCGKTMLAARLPSILPPMGLEAALETTAVHSVAGLLGLDKVLLSERPFRAPHSSVSSAGLLGSGPSFRPGEVSLAHQGVLFLDDLPEFQRQSLEGLRSALKSGQVIRTQGHRSTRLPASVLLVAAANPCPCGFLGHPGRTCLCTETDIARYRARLSSSGLHFDMQVGVEVGGANDISSEPESSSVVQERVVRARAAQIARQGVCNADLPRETNEAYLTSPAVLSVARLTESVGLRIQEILEQACLSGQDVDRVLKVARTIADLDGVNEVGGHHVAEALLFHRSI